MDATNHFAYECEVCDETWPSEEDRKEHEIGDHHYCAVCDRWFQSYNNKQMVSKSSVSSRLA